MGAEEFGRWHATGVWATTRYRGIPCQQSPCDLWSLQEIAHDTRPRAVVQTGVAAGGTLLYLYDLLRAYGEDVAVVGVDLAPPTVSLSSRPGLTVVRGDSSDPAVAAEAWRLVGDRPCLVVLDSDHSRDHVLRELALYAGLVPPGGYLLVEDTCIGPHCCPEILPGPAEALADWLPAHPDFTRDESRTRWGLSQHPGGYLRRAGGT